MDFTTLQLMGIAGMENASELSDVAEGIGNDLPTTPEEVETQTAEVAVAETTVEVQELASIVAEVAEAVEEQEEQVAELKDTIDGLEGLVNSGAYSAPAAALLYAKAQKLNDRLGGRDTGFVLGAESLGDACSAQMAMNAGMEAFTDTIKKYSNAAIAFIKNLWDTLIAFLSGLFNRTAGIRRMAESLKKRLDAAGFEPKKKVKLGKWNAFVDYEGKLVDSSDIGVKVQKMTMGLVELIGTVDGITKSAANDKNEAGNFRSSYNKTAMALKDLISGAGNKKEQKAATKDTAMATIGGVQVLVSVDSGNLATLEDVSRAAKATRVQFKPAYDAKGVKIKGEINAKRSLSDLKELVDGVITSSKLAETYKNNQTFSAKGRDVAIANLKVMAGKENQTVPKAITAIKAIYAMSNLALTQGMRYSCDVMAATNQCVKAHL